MRPGALFLSAAAGLIAGCGGCGDTVDEFPPEAAKAICEKIYSCCTAAELSGNSTYGPNQAACESSLRNQLAGPNRLKQSESKGRLVYHDDLFDECIAQYKALSCEQLKSNVTTVTPACDSFIEPKVAVGGSCGADDECVDGTCAGETGTADGTCEAFLSESASCADGGSCGDGLYCESGQKTCQQLKADGTNCNANFECKTGGCNGKDPDAGTPGTCGLKGGEGTTCYATTGCSSTEGNALTAFAALALLSLLGPSRFRTRASTV